MRQTNNSIRSASALFESEGVHPRISKAARELGLTPRENEIVELFAMGRSTATLAKELCISEATIRTHLRNIFSVLKINSRVQLVVMVLTGILREVDSQYGPKQEPSIDAGAFALSGETAVPAHSSTSPQQAII